MPGQTSRQIWQCLQICSPPLGPFSDLTGRMPSFSISTSLILFSGQTEKHVPHPTQSRHFGTSIAVLSFTFLLKSCLKYALDKMVNFSNSKFWLHYHFILNYIDSIFILIGVGAEWALFYHDIQLTLSVLMQKMKISPAWNHAQPIVLAIQF